MPVISKLASPALLLAALSTPAAAYPSSFGSGNLPAVSARGQAFGSMGITNYEAAADPICEWTHNVPNTGYVVGSSYKLWIGNKADGAAATVGMVYKVGTAANANTGSDGGSKMAFKEIDWTATDVASVELKAICSAGGSYDKMWIAEPVTLNKAAAVKPAAKFTCPSAGASGTSSFNDTSKDWLNALNDEACGGVTTEDFKENQQNINEGAIR